MRFGKVAVDAAEGAVLVHAVTLPGLVFKKGRTLSAADVGALRERGVGEVVAARLEPGDVPEDEAAARLAAAVAGPDVRLAKAFTGRANLHAQARGVLLLDVAGIDRLNGVDEAVTLGTLPQHAVVEPGQMVATVKIIPFAAPAHALDACLAMAAEAPLVRVAAFVPKRYRLVQTMLPGHAGQDAGQDRAGDRGAGARRRRHARRREPLRPRRDRARGRDRPAAGRLRHPAGGRRLGDHRSARRAAGRHRGGGRAGAALRHAGRPRQPAAAGRAARPAGAGPAGLLPLAQAQRLRLGAGAAGGGRAGDAGRHRAHGRGGAADGDRRAGRSRARSRSRGPSRRGSRRWRRWCWRPASRGGWASATSC